MTQLLTPAPARPRWRAALATFALVGAMLAAGSALPASAEDIGTGPGTIGGTVTDGEGQPLEGAFVSADLSFGEGTAFWASTSTDAAGQYLFTDLALDYTYSIQASLSEHQPAIPQGVSLSSESPTGTADFVLLPFATGTGTISGHITVDGAPLSGQEISATNQSNYQNLTTYSDENGYYEFTGLTNAEWIVSTYLGQGYQPLYPQSVVLSGDDSTATSDLPYLTWPVGTASISGVVTDSATGEPIANVSVSASSNDAPHSSNVSTDESGAFSFDLLPAGTYYVSFSAEGYLNATSELVLLDGEAATSSRALIAANSSISGHVQDANGDPVAGWAVDAVGPDNSIGGAITDENGDYVIAGLGAGDWTLEIGSGAYERQIRVVTAVANEDVTADFTLQFRTVGNLGGMVFGPSGEYYTAPICAALYSAKTKKPLSHVATYGENYGDGTYTFADLKPGTYTVEFRDCDSDPATKFDKVFLGGVKNFKDATFVTVVAGVDTWDNYVTLTLR